ncbi:MAG: hypothetical protein LUG91_03820 [Ruminococcus sp.]|nr:hypothetical protein [Ruminococcus sp.]
MKSFLWILACIFCVSFIVLWIYAWIYVKIILKNREKQLIPESNVVAAMANELPDNVRKVFLKLRDGGGKISVLAEDVDFEFENGVILSGYLIDYSWCNGKKYYIRSRDTISNPHTTLCVNIRECTEFFPSEGRKVIEESYVAFLAFFQENSSTFS